MQTAGLEELEAGLRDALREFAAHLDSEPWVGKEHDCVNRFAHGYLIPRCQAGSLLHHPTQIGIEVGVAQPPGIGIKAAARKDLVIWPRPWMSCYDNTWRPVHYPTVVMEWKTLREGFRFSGTAHDHAWLTAFTRSRPETLGLSIVVSVAPSPTCRLTATRFIRGEATPKWLVAMAAA